MIWKTLRVSAKTLVALQRYRDNLQVQVSSNKVKFKRFAPSFRVSLGEAIDYLIEQKDNHTKRGRKGFDPGGRDKDKVEVMEPEPGEEHPRGRILGNGDQYPR